MFSLCVALRSHVRHLTHTAPLDHPQHTHTLHRYSKSKQRMYYKNHNTGETTWVKPLKPDMGQIWDKPLKPDVDAKADTETAEAEKEKESHEKSGKGVKGRDGVYSEIPRGERRSGDDGNIRSEDYSDDDSDDDDDDDDDHSETDSNGSKSYSSHGSSDESESNSDQEGEEKRRSSRGNSKGKDKEKGINKGVNDEEGEGSEVDSVASPSSIDTTSDRKRDLPDGWQRRFSNTKKKHFYLRMADKHTQWHFPHSHLSRVNKGIDTGVNSTASTVHSSLRDSPKLAKVHNNVPFAGAKGAEPSNNQDGDKDADTDTGEDREGDTNTNKAKSKINRKSHSERERRPSVRKQPPPPPGAAGEYRIG